MFFSARPYVNQYQKPFHSRKVGMWEDDMDQIFRATYGNRTHNSREGFKGRIVSFLRYRCSEVLRFAPKTSSTPMSHVSSKWASNRRHPFRAFCKQIIISKLEPGVYNSFRANVALCPGSPNSRQFLISKLTKRVFESLSCKMSRWWTPSVDPFLNLPSGNEKSETHVALGAVSISRVMLLSIQTGLRVSEDGLWHQLSSGHTKGPSFGCKFSSAPSWSSAAQSASQKRREEQPGASIFALHIRKIREHQKRPIEITLRPRLVAFLAKRENLWLELFAELLVGWCYIHHEIHLGPRNVYTVVRVRPNFGSAEPLFDSLKNLCSREMSLKE
ncbi:unnamed protein product [Nesidiocoris tenuis]|uniref:Uncharacterized protein n=1 Tax=Nesidiocoris tenuis TaxID=355587 RepID=A0A6H5GDG3_9HEMI|nr:unnamed protein product [Nesidiocoris tenuis]